jgi:hypothetical protein
MCYIDGQKNRNSEVLITLQALKIQTGVLRPTDYKSRNLIKKQL